MSVLALAWISKQTAHRTTNVTISRFYAFLMLWTHCVLIPFSFNNLIALSNRIIFPIRFQNVRKCVCKNEKVKSKEQNVYLQCVRCNVSYSACVVRNSSKRSSKNFSIFFTVSGATLSSSRRFSIFDRILVVSHSGLSIFVVFSVVRSYVFFLFFSVGVRIKSLVSKMFHFCCCCC